MKPLTPKQKLFCHEYMKDKNGTQAYMRVFKTKNENSAKVLASRTLTKVNVSDYLNKLKEKELKKADITTEWVLNGIKSIGDNKKAKDSDRLKAFELGGKYKKIWTDRIEQLDINYDITQLPADIIERIANAKGNEEILKIIAEYERLKTAS